MEYIECFIIKSAKSVHSKNKRKPARQSFKSKTTTKTYQRSKIIDLTKSVKMLKIREHWFKDNNIVPGDLEQFMELPMALATPFGFLYQGDKPKSRQFYKETYKDDIFYQGEISNSDKVKVVVLDAMFILLTNVGNRKTAGQLTNFLYSRWVTGNFRYTKHIRVTSIHVVFDLQAQDVLNPKVFERKRRDQTTYSSYDCVEITDTMKLPSEFQRVLHNRHNKQKVVHYICDKFVQLGKRLLRDGQYLIIGGGFSDPGIVKHVTTNHVENLPMLENNHFEGDTMVWLHAAQSLCDNVIVDCPDNHVFNVGLPVAQNYPHKTFIVHYMYYGDQAYFMDLSELLRSLKKTIQLKYFPPERIATLMLNLYSATGSDCVSYFKWHSKKSFYNTFLTIQSL